MSISLLGGKNKELKCKCGALRWPESKLCPDCWGKENPGKGTRRSGGVVVQAYLPKDLWQAVNFASSMMRKGTYRPKAIKIASNYYDVSYDDVQSGLSQRPGRSQKGKG